MKTPVPVYKIKTKEMLEAGFDILNLDSPLQGRSYDASNFHRHTFFELFYFTRSGGFHEIDFRKFPITAHSVHFVSPGQIHHLNLKSAKGYVICFTEEFYSLPGYGLISHQFPFFGISHEPLLNLSKKENNILSQQINLLVQAHRDTQGRGYEIMRSYVNVMLLTLKQIAIMQGRLLPDTDNRKIVSEFRHKVNEMFLKGLSTRDYASLLHVTPNYLNSLCRKEAGKTATQIIHERVLLEAKRLLYSTDLSVKEVSFGLNFESPAYFTRFFKKQTATTPALYREQFARNR